MIKQDLCVPFSSGPLNLSVFWWFRIGELREVMDDILRKQCDYDPASGESYDFDRSVGADVKSLSSQDILGNRNHLKNRNKT